MSILNYDQVQDELNQNAENIILLNVLPPEYFNMAHIPRSVNLPLGTDNFSGKVTEILQAREQTDIIVYSANDSCTESQKAYENLKDNGFTNVKHFKGGTQEWHESGGKLVSANDGECGTSCGCG